MTFHDHKTMNRRQFISRSTAAAAFTLVNASQVRGAEANGKIRLGLIGCGGRGQWIANLFAGHGGFEIAAAHDYFADRVDQTGNRFQVPAERRYTGLSGYKRLVEAELDAVAIISPPYFHPEQAAAAVDRGLHVYIAKPVAVDVPGCRSISASAKRATAGKQVFLVDFQTRVDPFYMEALKRVHQGAIGDFAFGEASYHAGRLGKKGEDNSPEGRLRNWVFDQALSGDIITEQNIHTLDVMSWIMNATPLRVSGTCARKVRTDVGNCNDTFSLVYEYPNNVGITFSSRQFNGHGTQPEGIRNRMFGSDGVLETKYGGNVMIRGKNYYRGGSSPGIYQEGAVNNIAAFHKNILEGQHDNPTVEPSVRSNLVTIMGRMAAYSGRTVTWDDLLRSEERLEGRMDGLKT